MKILSLIYTILCLLGLVYQVYLVSFEYLKYGVSSSITLKQSNEYTLPSLSTCLEFVEIFDYDLYNQKHNKNVVFNDTTTETVYLSGNELLKLVTLEDMHQFTPSAESAFKNCEIRNATTFGYNFHTKISCYEKFDIEKYVISSKMCYKITLKSQSKSERSSNVYRMESTYFTPNDAGVLFYIYFNETLFNRYDFIVNVMHPSDNYPFSEFPLSQLRTRRFNFKTRKSIVNLFGSLSSSITVSKLPPPYETFCQDYKSRNGSIKYRDSQHCLIECINQNVYETFQKASLTIHYFEGLEMKLLSDEDFSEENFYIKYGNILSKCNQTCPRNDCTFISTYTFTTGVSYAHTGIFVMLPDSPSFDINYGAKVDVLETLNFICSSLGIWLGFSFLAINPFNNDDQCSPKIDIKSIPNKESDSIKMIQENKRQITKLTGILFHTNSRMNSLENLIRSKR